MTALGHYELLEGWLICPPVPLSVSLSCCGMPAVRLDSEPVDAYRFIRSFRTRCIICYLRRVHGVVSPCCSRPLPSRGPGIRKDSQYLILPVLILSPPPTSS